MTYTKTLSSSDNIAFVKITGWGKPGVTFSQGKLQEILAQLEIIGEDMISSKEGKAGEALHFLEQEIGSLIRSCNDVE
jgi:hypothetical protein